MATEGMVSQIDAAIASFFADGNAWTVALAGVLVIILIWPILTGKDPDIHPFLLAKQAQTSPVRQPGESGVYRANEIPYGYPLRRGLGVKDPGAPAWSAGRDGDLRDIWRKAVQGATDEKGNSLGQRGKLMTILGRKNVVSHDLDQVTAAINTIGKFVQEKRGETVAVHLSNSVELLATIFASAFYSFKPVLIPTGLDQQQLPGFLSKIRADLLIAEAATVDLKSALKSAPSIKNIVWVVKEGSQHMDWTEKPDGVGQVKIHTWHDLVRERKGSSEVLPSEKDSKTGPISSFWKGKGDQYELIEYSSENIVAGIGGLLSTLVRDYKLSHKDLLLPTASLTDTYALCWTLAALYSGASVALNSVAGDTVDLTSATLGVSPTIIVSSSGTIAEYHEKIAAYGPGLPRTISNYFRQREMLAGSMPTSKPGDISPNLSKLRALFVSQKGTDTKRIQSSVLAAMRVTLVSRVAFALTAAPVAGAVSQTNILDYRDKGKLVNCGPPVSSLELLVAGDDEALDRDRPEGELYVRGPAVVGGGEELGFNARIDADRTVTLL